MKILRALAAGILMALLAGCMSTPPQAPDSRQAPPPAMKEVAGAWELTVESPMGTRTSEAIFQQNGEQLSGRMISSRGEAPLTGTLNADAIAFDLTINVQGQELKLDYSGTVTGDTMSGTVQFGGFGDGKWSAKRK